MENWIIILFAFVAVIGMIISRKYTISRISKMERISSGSVFSENDCKASDIWNDMGNKRYFTTADCIEETDESLEDVLNDLPEDEIEMILDEVVNNG